MILLVWRRVKRTETLLLGLMALVMAGRVPRVRVRTVFVCGDVAEALPRPVDRVAAGDFVPRRFGWLVGMVGHEAAACRSQLEHLLTEPEMAALVRDVPQARRLLAPLCRMLGVVLDAPPAVRQRVRRVRVPPVEVVVPAWLPRAGYMASAKWPPGVVGPPRKRRFA